MALPPAVDFYKGCSPAGRASAEKKAPGARPKARRPQGRNARRTGPAGPGNAARSPAAPEKAPSAPVDPVPPQQKAPVEAPPKKAAPERPKTQPPSPRPPGPGSRRRERSRPGRRKKARGQKAAAKAESAAKPAEQPAPTPRRGSCQKTRSQGSCGQRPLPRHLRLKRPRPKDARQKIPGQKAAAKKPAAEKSPSRKAKRLPQTAARYRVISVFKQSCRPVFSTGRQFFVKRGQRPRPGSFLQDLPPNGLKRLSSPSSRKSSSMRSSRRRVAGAAGNAPVPARILPGRSVGVGVLQIGPAGGNPVAEHLGHIPHRHPLPIMVPVPAGS